MSPKSPPQPHADHIVNHLSSQTALVRQKFVEVLQNYQNVERDYRQRYRQRVERQFKIGEHHLVPCPPLWNVLTWSAVKPDASPEEVAAVVNDTEGSGAQIFTQAVWSS